MKNQEQQNQDTRLLGNLEPFWITGAHPITGFLSPRFVERREQERPAKLKKLQKQNWR